MTDIRQVTPVFAVAPQLSGADFVQLAAAGFKSVINNRPDGEAPGQISSADAERAARAAGLAYRAIPVTGAPSPAQALAMKEALSELAAPVLAYCRSGTRSITTWALAQSGSLAGEDILALARAAGYDLSALRGALGS